MSADHEHGRVTSSPHEHLTGVVPFDHTLPDVDAATTRHLTHSFVEQLIGGPANRPGVDRSGCVEARTGEVDGHHGFDHVDCDHLLTCCLCMLECPPQRGTRPRRVVHADH